MGTSNDSGSKVISHVRLVAANGERVDLANNTTTSAENSDRSHVAHVAGFTNDSLSWKVLAQKLAWNLRYCTHPAYDQRLRREILAEYEEKNRS
jgi:hypothetical protein